MFLNTSNTHSRSYPTTFTWRIWHGWPWSDSFLRSYATNRWTLCAWYVLCGMTLWWTSRFSSFWWAVRGKESTVRSSSQRWLIFYRSFLWKLSLTQTPVLVLNCLRLITILLDLYTGFRYVKNNTLTVMEVDLILKSLCRCFSLSLVFIWSEPFGD